MVSWKPENHRGSVGGTANDFATPLSEIALSSMVLGLSLS